MKFNEFVMKFIKCVIKFKLLICFMCANIKV